MRPITTKILADTADLVEMRAVSSFVEGFTTNPSLLKQAGVGSYTEFIGQALTIAGDRPISFEVLADDFVDMAEQARSLSEWGKNVFVKIPITNSKGESAAPLIRELSAEGIKLNVTAILHRLQVERAVEALVGKAPSFISIFAGRIADTGVDPAPLMLAMSHYVRRANAFLLWASAREVYNVVQASECVVPYITLSPSLIRKLPLLGRDPIQYSLETVREFYRDARHVERVLS